MLVARFTEKEAKAFVEILKTEVIRANNVEELADAIMPKMKQKYGRAVGERFRTKFLKAVLFFITAYLEIPRIVAQDTAVSKYTLYAKTFFWKERICKFGSS